MGKKFREGGILAALWIISGAYEQGISFELRKIPVAQETIEICELFDLNPYRLSSGECLLMAVENGGDAVKLLSEAGIPSAVIGKVEKGIARKMVGSERPDFWNDRHRMRSGSLRMQFLKKNDRCNEEEQLCVKKFWRSLKRTAELI